MLIAAVQVVGEDVLLHSGVAITESRSDVRLSGKHDDSPFEDDFSMLGIFLTHVPPLPSYAIEPALVILNHRLCVCG